MYMNENTLVPKMKDLYIYKYLQLHLVRGLTHKFHHCCYIVDIVVHNVFLCTQGHIYIYQCYHIHPYLNNQDIGYYKNCLRICDVVHNMSYCQEYVYLLMSLCCLVGFHGLI